MSQATQEQIKAYLRAEKELHRLYEIKETLGSGAFSEVKRGIERASGKHYAIKIIDRAKCIGKENMIQSEVKILQKVKHNNIIQLFGLYETAQKIYLVMELVSGGELFDSIVSRGHYTERDAALIVFKILGAVDYLHQQGIAHRDLKPENLLFYDKNEDSKIMISDFGLSRIFSDEEMMKTACGTPGYVAPEVLKRRGYGKEVDLWSIGVITYILLCGYPPFYDENNQELYQQIMRGDYCFDSPNWDGITYEAKDFISHLLVVDPRKRYTTQDALRHPFIRRYMVRPAIQHPQPVHAAQANAESRFEQALASIVTAIPALTLKSTQPSLVTCTQVVHATFTHTQQPQPSSPEKPSAIAEETETPKQEPDLDAATDSSYYSVQQQPINLAKRVSSNLRERGWSNARRRVSTESQQTINSAHRPQGGHRRSTGQPQHAHPLPPTPDTHMIIAEETLLQDAVRESAHLQPPQTTSNSCHEKLEEVALQDPTPLGKEKPQDKDSGLSMNEGTAN